MEYLIVKTVHILSATILFGTGLGTAYFMLMAWRAGDVSALRIVARTTVRADWLFTLPAVIIQPITGVWLMQLLGFPFSSPWFAWVIGLYILAGTCWLPVVWIQLRLQWLAHSDTGIRSAEFDRLMRIWIRLGTIAFSAVLALFVLMVFRYELA